MLVKVLGDYTFYLEVTQFIKGCVTRLQYLIINSSVTKDTNYWFVFLTLFSMEFSGQYR